MRAGEIIFGMPHSLERVLAPRPDLGSRIALGCSPAPRCADAAVIRICTCPLGLGDLELRVELVRFGRAGRQPAGKYRSAAVFVVVVVRRRRRHLEFPRKECPSQCGGGGGGGAFWPFVVIVAVVVVRGLGNSSSSNSGNNNYSNHGDTDSCNSSWGRNNQRDGAPVGRRDDDVC